MGGSVNVFQRAVVALGRMVFGRWPRYRSGYPQIIGERNYDGLVGDGSGSALLMACVSWVINAFTQMRPMIVDADGEEIEDHPALKLFTRPTYDPDLGFSYYPWQSLIAGVILSFIVDGNGGIIKVRGAGGAGRPVQLWYAPHTTVEPKTDPEDPRVYVAYYDYCPDGTSHTPIRVQDFIHVRDGIDPNNTRKGLSKVKTLLREIYTDEEAARWIAALLHNHSVPGLLITPDEALLNPDDAKLVKADIIAQTSGDNRGLPIVLSGPSKITQFGFSPEQMKLGDIRDIPEERISAAIGIPAAVVGFGAGLQSTKVGATMAELVDLAWQNGVLPRASIIAAYFTEHVLSEWKDGSRFRFDYSEVPIMADYHQKRAQTWQVMVQGGWAMVSEARRANGLMVGPRDKVYLRQTQMQEVDATKAPEEVPALPEPTPLALTAGDNAAAADAADGEDAAAADATAEAPPKTLSARQQSIAGMLARGMVQKQIASDLRVSERTVARDVVVIRQWQEMAGSVI